MTSLGSSIYIIMSSAYNDSSTSFFAIWILFISCLIAVARTSNTVLKRSGESGHPCLVPDFSRKAFRFSLFSVMLAVGVSQMDFVKLRYVSFIWGLYVLIPFA